MPQQKQVTEHYIGICYYSIRIQVWFINWTINVPYLLDINFEVQQ